MNSTLLAKSAPLSIAAAAALVLGACAPAAAPAPTAAPAKPAAAAPAKSAAEAKPAVAAKPAAEAKPASSSAISPELQKIIDGAKNETVVKGHWSATSFGGAAGLQKMVDAINKQYGLTLKAQFTPGPNQQGVLDKIAREVAAGQPASSDIYLGNAPAMLDAVKNPGVLRSIDWNTILERPIPTDGTFEPIAQNNIGVAFATTFVGITYNTEAIKPEDVPQKLEDVLDPKWKGKIASTPYAAGMREFATPSMLGEERILEFTEKLSGQIGGLIRCGEPERLTSQEFLMLVFDCGGDNAILSQRQGMPLGHALIDEATVMHMRYAAVPTNSQAPNAATLLIRYLNSPEGQKHLWESDGMDYPFFPESQQKATLDRVKSSGAKVAINTPQWLASVPDFAATQEKLEKILQKGA